MPWTGKKKRPAYTGQNVLELENHRDLGTSLLVAAVLHAFHSGDFGADDADLVQELFECAPDEDPVSA